MPIKFRDKTLLAKVETTYGQDATPTGAANAIQVMDVTITPLDGETVTHDYVRPDLGARPQIPVNTHVSMEFSVSMAGSGTAGVAPAYGVLMRGAGMAEIVTAATDVKYRPVGSGEESVTLYFNMGGNRHKLLGARGSVGLEAQSGQLPRFRYKFVGLYTGPDAVAQPTIDLSPFKQPVPVNNANTPDFSIHGYSAVLKSVSLDLGVQPRHRDYVNSAAVLITDRQGSGSASIEAPAIGTKDFFSASLNADLGPLSLVHGITAGNIIGVDCPKVQVIKPRYGDDQGIAFLEMDLVPIPDAGNDELVITVK